MTRKLASRWYGIGHKSATLCQLRQTGLKPLLGPRPLDPI